mmetsp:Transcript_35610/g.90553  ORF Transcript_35610/g.90553 Transcript_35610/m.90553 type:complete len:285 (-) Transcript_35610:683-1537(-)
MMSASASDHSFSATASVSIAPPAGLRAKRSAASPHCPSMVCTSSDAQAFVPGGTRRGTVPGQGWGPTAGSDKAPLFKTRSSIKPRLSSPPSGMASQISAPRCTSVEKSSLGMTSRLGQKPTGRASIASVVFASRFSTKWLTRSCLLCCMATSTKDLPSSSRSSTPRPLASSTLSKSSKFRKLAARSWKAARRGTGARGKKCLSMRSRPAFKAVDKRAPPKALLRSSSPHPAVWSIHCSVGTAAGLLLAPLATQVEMSSRLNSTDFSTKSFASARRGLASVMPKA